MRSFTGLAAAAALLLVPAGAALAAAPEPVTVSAPPASDAVVAVAAWAIRSKDPAGKPFAIVDKGAARVYVFGPDGKLKGEAPALVGSAPGDVSTPYTGDRELSSIPPHERTTPAGRFLAGWGKSTKGEKTLWVDYRTAVSIHPLASVTEGERREERLASFTPDDNRITFGCINVDRAFFDTIIRPTFKKTGVFYVLPEATPLMQAFPGFVAPPGLRLAGTAAAPPPLLRRR
ncbi:MAG TPA: L,D-transpeptidase [Caulobacteraceae bacterium]